MSESYALEHSDETMAYVHDADACAHRNMCPIHKKTAHSMRSFPQHWRSDRGIMERTCPHGIGHPDPDQWDYMIEKYGMGAAVAEFTHGCDFCCEGSIDFTQVMKDVAQQEILQEIAEERTRQEAIHPNSTPANPEMFSEARYCILAEEVGEIAKSLNDGDHDNLREELIQSAAVCVAWIEAIDHIGSMR